MFTEEVNKHLQEEENNYAKNNNKEELLIPNLQISNHSNNNVSFDNALNWIGNPGKILLLILFY